MYVQGAGGGQERNIVRREEKKPQEVANPANSATATKQKCGNTTPTSNLQRNIRKLST